MNIDIFSEGGPILIAILLCGAASVIIFAERLVYLHKSRIQFGDFLNGIFNILRKGKIREALAICDDAPGPVAKLLHTAISHRDEEIESLRLMLRNTGRTEIARMERRLAVLSTIIKTTPLLGLLGGLVGLFSTVITIRTNLSIVQTVYLTSGLYQSLITAIAGLAVMIPVYIMYNILVVRIDRIIIDMEQATIDILAFIPRINGSSQFSDDSSKAEKQ